MARTNETPAGKAGESRDMLGGWSLETLSPLPFQAQFLIVAHNVRPELASMLAALAFGGGGFHG